MHEQKHDAKGLWGIPPAQSEATPRNASALKGGGAGGALLGLVLLGLLVAAATGPAPSTYTAKPRRQCAKDSPSGHYAVKTRPVPVRRDNSQLWCGFALGILAVAVAATVFVAMQHLATALPVRGVFWAGAHEQQHLESGPSGRSADEAHQ